MKQPAWSALLSVAMSTVVSTPAFSAHDVTLRLLNSIPIEVYEAVNKQFTVSKPDIHLGEDAMPLTCVQEKHNEHG